METEYYHHIARQYFRGEASPAQETELNNWLQVAEEHRQLFATWRSEWHQQALAETSPKTSAAWAKMQTRMQSPHQVVSRFPHPHVWYSVAAVALLLVGIALWLLRPDADNPIYTSGEKQTITLLPDDSCIRCTGAKNEDICTAKGQKQTLVLPDGSMVIMEEETTLSYDFNDNKRQVTFAGKADFEVARDTLCPFTVRVGEYSVTVVGTRFTLCAKPDEWQYIISLQEGAVKVGYKNDTILMSPSETLRFYPKKIEMQSFLTI